MKNLKFNFGDLVKVYNLSGTIEREIGIYIEQKFVSYHKVFLKNKFFYFTIGEIFHI